MARYVSLELSDKHLTHFCDMLKKADGNYLEWGIRKGAGMHPKADMPIANLQAIHEFRDDEWRRPLFHIQSAKIEDGHLSKYLTVQMESFLVQAAKGGRTPATYFLGNFGEIVVKDAKGMYGRKGISYRGMKIPPNTEATKQIKGHDKPLLELGVLKNSVTFTTSKRI